MDCRQLEILRTILCAVNDINRSLVRLSKNCAIRRAEEDDERLLSFNGGILNVIHDGQTASLKKVFRGINVSPLKSWIDYLQMCYNTSSVLPGLKSTFFELGM